MKNINITITQIAIIVIAVFSGVIIDWQFEKDWTTLSRDNETVAKSKWVVEAERTYINKNSPYRISHMCPRIIAEGGYETPTRCYYAPDTYELLSRSLINTKIDALGEEIIKSVPFYAYGTRGAYSGYIKEITVFSEKTTKIEEFPDSYMVAWEPKDTRNYKLIWRLEKLDTSAYVNDDCLIYKDCGCVGCICSYTFGNVKIDLKDECGKLDYVIIEKGKATFYFRESRGIQDMDISFVDPEMIEKKEIKSIVASTGISVSMPEKWIITDIDDTEAFYDIDSVSYDGERFDIKLKAHDGIKNITKDAVSIEPITICKEDKNLKEPVGVEPKEGEKGKEPKVGEPTGLKENETVSDLPELKSKLTIPSKDYGRDKTLKTVNFFDDYNRTTGKANYTFDMKADYEQLEDVIVCTEEHICDVEEKLVSYKRKEVVFKLGDASIYVTATLDTDLKIVQTGLANDTDYVAGLDVSQGKLFMSQTDSSYDLTDGLVGWWSFDNVDNGTTAWSYAGNNNHGTMTNMNENLDNGSSGWTSTGNLSYGMDFDGVDDYVTVSGGTSILGQGTEVTVSLWAKESDRLSNFDRLIDMGWAGYGSMLMSHNSANGYNLFAISGLSGCQCIRNFGVVTDDTWNHFVGIYNGTHTITYLNGGNKQTTVCSANCQNVVLNNTANLKIGGTASYFNGTIDDIKIWNRALSADEILAEYNKTLSDYETKVSELSSSAVTYDVISNTNTSVVVEVPEISEHYLFTPTYIRANHSSATNYTEFNTTDNSFYGSETITVTENYLGEGNLTRIRINNTAAMTEYDTYNINLSAELSFSPNDIQYVWYDSYSGNSDNSTLKQSTDYSQWVDTCEAGNTTGMVLCMSNNEIYGILAHDRSGNNNDGTLTNMNTGVDNGSSGWTRDGYFGNAINFDGSNDNINCGSDSSIDFDYTDSFTLSVYIKTFVADKSIIRKQGNGFYIITNSESYSRFYLQDEYEHGMTITGSVNITDDKWHNVVAVWDNSDNKTRIYTDGILDITSTAINTYNGSFANDADLLIGKYVYSETNTFYGTIDEVQIFNRALSAAEILAKYNLKKDYYDHLMNQEGNIAASENLDVYVTNGTIGNLGVDGTVTIVPQSNMTSSMWMIDFGLTGGYTTDYDYSCGDITTADVPAEVSTNKNGSYALSVSGEMSPLGYSEKLKFGLMKYPIRYTNDSYRAYFQVTDNLTKDTVTQLDFNVSDVLDRMNITTADVDTYRLYRISYFGGIYNDTSNCLEQPVWVGN